VKQEKIINMAERRHQKMLNQPNDRGMEMLAYAIVVLFVGILLFVVLAFDLQ